MSSPQAINTLKHHSLVLPANRPDMSDPIRAWKPNLLYTGWTGMFLFKFPFPVRKLMSQGIGSDTVVSSEGTHQCMEMQLQHMHVCQVKGRATRVRCPPLLDCVTRVEGTQMVPLVSVPDETMNFLNVFVGSLL